jgi:hypothetical protein
MMRWSVVLPLFALAACESTSGSSVPGDPPQIVTASGPTGGVVTCDPATAGGNCPLPLAITFRLPKGEFVSKVIVTFQGDGSDTGIDRAFTVPNTFGNGDTPVVVNVVSSVPSTIVRRGALFTYTVRLITGQGAESSPSTLTVSVQ